jgi:hypothetical protein
MSSRLDLRKSLPSDTVNWSEESRQRLLAACSELSHNRWHPAQPCEQCGRPVIFQGSRRIPFHAVCGDGCRYAVKLAQARARSAQRRPKATCETCGEAFTAKRTHARFCSSPCRQRAYRQRRHTEAAA